MGGELEKTAMKRKTATKSVLKTASRNHKSKLQPIIADENQSMNKKMNMRTTLKTINNNIINETKRGKEKMKKDKISVLSRNKGEQNEEKNVLELIHEKNAEKEDYDLIYSIISKHFFLQTYINVFI